MTTEHLIEKAAKAIRMADTEMPDIAPRLAAGWDEGLTDDETRNRCLRQARAALAVFEEAHPPTNDEREALACVAAKVDRVPDSDAVTIDKEDARVLLAGFRRSEVPEPSALPEYFAPRPPLTTNRFEVPEPSADWDRVHDRPADIYTPPEDRVVRPSPQGEPSDSQVLAAFNAFFRLEVDHVSERTSVRMRAALRAAAEAGGER